MSHELPLLPSIEHLRHQANSLLDLCRVGDPGAIEALCNALPEFRTQHIVQIAASVRLHHAQEVIARYYGFLRWQQMCEAVELSCRAASALSVAMEDPRMQDLEYRAGIARGKRLPEIGASKLSVHGVRYDVTDYLPAISPVAAARLRSGDKHAHINDLLPVISFPEMSDRLYELYIETDTVTNRPILFFDTMPDLHPKMAIKGIHQVIVPARGDKLYVLFDAAQLHETFIAHELGHIWVERVEQKEDYRHPKDQSNLPKATQFYHVQSFVMDLCVNDLLMRRGFDMSVIAADQAQTIVNYAENVAKRRPMKGKRVLAGVINTLAGALLEMERFPDGWAGTIKTALEMIEIGLPQAFEPAKGFVRSVLKHGYDDSEAIMRVVDECATLSFAATGERFDPANDLELIGHNEPATDKRPGFLAGIPSYGKREVLRAAAANGVTGTAKYNVSTYGDDASVSITCDDGVPPEPVRFCFTLPPRGTLLCSRGASNPIPTAHNMPSPQAGMMPVGSQWPNSTAVEPFHNNGQPFGAVHAAMEPFGSFQQPGIPDPYASLPDSVRVMMGLEPGKGRGTPTGFDPADFGGYGPHSREERFGVPKPADPFAEQRARNQRQNEQIQHEQEERQARIRIQNELLMQSRSETYEGKDLAPCLTPAGEEYAKLHPLQSAKELPSGRNYMAGVGLFLSRAGWEQQMDGEHPYGYAKNNPVTYIDPDGMQPSLSPPKPRQPNCTPVIYSCYRPIIVGQGINHTFFWVHYPCSPKSDRTIGYGPVGAFFGPETHHKGTYPQQPEDIDCIQKGTCFCSRTNCAEPCVTNRGGRIRIGDPQWDPNNFSLWHTTTRCWSFSDWVYDQCKCGELWGSYFKPEPRKIDAS